MNFENFVNFIIDDKFKIDSNKKINIKRAKKFIPKKFENLQIKI